VEDVGRAVTQRLRLEIKDAPVLLIGVWPGREEEIKFVKGFLAGLTEADMKYDTVVVEPRLPMIDQISATEQIDLKDDLARFAEGAKKAVSEGRRIVAIVPSSYSTQLISKNPADRLKTEFALEVTSVSLAPFPHNRDQEKNFEVACDTDAQDRSGAGALGCAILHKSRMVYRKKKDLKRFSSLLDQVGGRDYMMLMTPPAGPSAAPVESTAPTMTN
jgi:hypothetical protein